MKERDNIGSTARDQLANERTFLAWARTSLGLVGAGVILAKWTEAGTTTQVGGVAFIFWGAMIMVYAILRYRRVTLLLGRGKYRPANFGPLAVTVLGLVAAVVAAVIALH